MVILDPTCLLLGSCVSLPSFCTLRPDVISVVSVPEREQRLHWCFGHLRNSYLFLVRDAMHFWSLCLKLLKVYCYCIICLITILKVSIKKVGLLVLNKYWLANTETSLANFRIRPINIF